MPCMAQDIIELQAINFGNITPTTYGAVARVTIEVGGSYTSNNVVVNTAPEQGWYQVTGAPTNSAYTIDLPPSVTLNGPGGAFFTLDNFEVRPLTLITDSSGEDTFFITARMQTQGGGMTYPNGSYTGDITVTLNF